jgi:hypothetical protein
LQCKRLSVDETAADVRMEHFHIFDMRLCSDVCICGLLKANEFSIIKLEELIFLELFSPEGSLLPVGITFTVNLLWKRRDHRNG